VLPDALAERGAQVDVVALYDTVAEPLADDALRAAGEADYVTFTSSSTVKFFMNGIDGHFPSAARVVSIGPVTTATAREHGLEVHVEAERHDVDGVVQALVEDAAR
jgi:uroporphyrinogen III methyltransferase/synthase